MSGIDPKWVFYLGIAVTIEQGIGQGSVKLANVVPDTWAPFIIGWCTMLAFIGNIVMTALAGYSSKAAGPMIKPLVLVAVIAGSFFIFTGDAQAQAPRPRPIDQFNQKLKDDFSPAGKSTAALDNIAAILAKPFQDMATFIGADADAAVALSTAIPALQDGHGQQCWMAMKSFGDIIKAHPVPITFHVINDYETLRLLGIATNNLCSNVHCTQVFADATAMAQAASPMPLAIPSLHDLCTKVPQIAVVPPVSVPAPSPTPTP